MSETKSFEQTMAEVQSVTVQLTGCEKADFMCFDSTENKFFSTNDGRTRNWHDASDILTDTMASQRIMYSDSRDKAYIPVVGSDKNVIGVIAAEKQDGFDERDLNLFGIGGDIMNTIDLAIKKEENHLTAVTDNLTHLKNRDGLAEYQKTTLVPNSKTDTAVNIIMCDIDHFKSINDTYGHDAGDIILKNVAQVLSDHTRNGSDCAFRMGGEEMVCVLNCSPVDAIAAAERLRKAVEDTVHTVMHNGEPTEVRVTISVGIHQFEPEKNITAENVAQAFDEQFKFADNAVYAAKETGRNRVVSADADIMMDYLVSRCAEAMGVSENRDNLKEFSLREMQYQLLSADGALAERVYAQIDEFREANNYFDKKNISADIQNLYSVTKNDETRYFKFSDKSSDDLLKAAANSDNPYADMMYFGERISEPEYAEIQQSSRFGCSVEMNFDSGRAAVYVVNDGQGGIGEAERTYSNSTVTDVLISDYKEVLTADNETIDYITDYMSDDTRRAFEQICTEKNAVTAEEKLNIIKKDFAQDYLRAEVSNNRSDSLTEFSCSSAYANDLSEELNKYNVPSVILDLGNGNKIFVIDKNDGAYLENARKALNEKYSAEDRNDVQESMSKMKAFSDSVREISEKIKDTIDTIQKGKDER